ncbi:MAG: flagellar protein FlaG [Pyrinomonadaceae bacterium]
MQTSTISFPANVTLPGRQFGEPLPDVTAKEKAPPVKERKLAGPVESEEIAKLKSSLAEHNIELKFSKDDETNALVVQLIDEKTGESIQQFPSDVSLKLAANFIKPQGHFIDKVK